MRIHGKKIFILIAVLLFLSGSAFAASISFESTTDLLGQGLGDKATVLVVKTPNGQTTTEWGSVTDVGGVETFAGASILTGAGQSKLWTKAGLNAELDTTLTASNFCVLLNVSEPGSDKALDLSTFSLLFYNASDALVLTATYTALGTPAAPSHLVQVGAGTGSAGYLFQVNFAPGEYNLWTKVGAIIPENSPITDAAGDHEDISIVQCPTIPVPPAAYAGGALLSALGIQRLRRRHAA